MVLVVGALMVLSLSRARKSFVVQVVAAAIRARAGGTVGPTDSARAAIKLSATFRREWVHLRQVYEYAWEKLEAVAAFEASQ